jgi:hypothetical protein
MHTPPSNDLSATVAALVADGTVKRVDGPQGPVFLVPAAFYKSLMTDALAWRRLVQQKVVGPADPPPEDLPSAESLAAKAFGPNST